MCYYTDYDAIYSLFYLNGIDLFYEDLDYITFSWLLDNFLSQKNMLVNRIKIRSASPSESDKYQQKYNINPKLYN